MENKEAVKNTAPDFTKCPNYKKMCYSCDTCLAPNCMNRKQKTQKNNDEMFKKHENIVRDFEPQDGPFGKWSYVGSASKLNAILDEIMNLPRK